MYKLTRHTIPFEPRDVFGSGHRHYGTLLAEATPFLRTGDIRRLCEVSPRDSEDTVFRFGEQLRLIRRAAQERNDEHVLERVAVLTALCDTPRLSVKDPLDPSVPALLWLVGRLLGRTVRAGRIFTPWEQDHDETECRSLLSAVVRELEIGSGFELVSRLKALATSGGLDPLRDQNVEAAAFGEKIELCGWSLLGGALLVSEPSLPDEARKRIAQDSGFQRSTVDHLCALSQL